MSSVLLDRRSAVFGFALLASCRAAAPPRAAGPAVLETLRLQSGYIALRDRAKPGVLGLGVSLGKIAWVSDDKARFPMQSVFKVFLAAAALAAVDSGQLTLSESITLTRQDLVPWYSPIVAAWKGEAMTLPIVDLIALAVQKSDNLAADVLMKRIGGPPAVMAWLHGKAIEGISVDRYEKEVQPDTHGMGPFQPAWADPKAWIAARDAVPAAVQEAATARYLADPRDTATLPGSLDFLTRLANGELLSAPSTRLLLRLMTDSMGLGRLHSGLPEGASLAHKTGSSATDLGLTPATNDVGIVTLPNGRRFAVAAFLSGSTATEVIRNGLIADAARLAVNCVA
ncbi:MAG TPA: class A beta-lactamase [Caulobacteraceae bacterium]